MTTITRRRFLAITAAAIAIFPGVASAHVARWTGYALGGPVSMKLVGMSDSEAAPIFALIEAELSRLEGIFSLYRDDSELSRLNKNKVLNAPSPELLQLLSLCDALHNASAGAFDPSIQPLWTALALQKSPERVAAARALVGWDQLSFGTSSVRLNRGGSLTLNGVAQGAITDRIGDLLRSQGLRNVLLDMGEVAAMGNGPSGPWSIGVALPDGRLVHRLTTSDRAVATSAPVAMGYGADQRHIISPSGHAARQKLVCVSAAEAAIADGLSTAACIMSPKQVDVMMHRFPSARVEKLITA